MGHLNQISKDLGWLRVKPFEQSVKLQEAVFKNSFFGVNYC